MIQRGMVRVESEAETKNACTQMSRYFPRPNISKAVESYIIYILLKDV